MSAETETPPQETTPKGKKYRLVVQSAEEAVGAIREKLGPSARVLSVRQMGGQGLSKFISSPKLEVIVELPENQEENSSDALIPAEESAEGAPQPLAESESEKQEPTVSEAQSANELLSDSTDISSLLERAGFDRDFLSTVQTWPRWENIREMSIPEALNEISLFLRDRFREIEPRPATSKVAFFGPPGAGKTTTLCKMLANEVFLNQRIPHVLKLENGTPNPDDALRIFCEVLGVTLFRDAADLPPPTEESQLYLDFPGLSATKKDEWVQMGKRLDELQVDTRVLVVNAAYDGSIVKTLFQLAGSARATHVIFTHFDELPNSTKLWPLILGGGLTPLCICTGQNVTGDYTPNVLNQLMANTFPKQILARSRT
ncbi:MAG: hypothetical protein CMI30_05970 [Opitutae bacterium]|nr:hypothetical protein [Opitutae bacterium]|tara:strand:- start:161 stop:1279 length:1119 start_codon:yes stop_codon:yes gene_type:complete